MTRSCMSRATVLNKAQRADKAESGDEKWRALDGRPLMRTDRGSGSPRTRARPKRRRWPGSACRWSSGKTATASRSAASTQDTIAAYSSRAAQIEEQLAELLLEYRQIYGRAPDRAALYKLRKRVTLETRKAKPKPKQGGAETAQDRARAAEEALAAWIRKASDASVQELASLHEAAEAYALEHPEAVPEQLPGEAERERVIRAAIAEAQRQHPAWTRAHLEWELYRQMPVLPAAADWCAYLNDMADDALTGRIPDTGVIRIAPVPDLVDVSSLDHRKDGTSVYRPPGEARFATAAHIDTEEWVLEKASKGAVAAAGHRGPGGGRAGRDGPGPAAAPGRNRAAHQRPVLLLPGRRGRHRENAHDGRVQQGVGAAHRRPGDLPDPVGERRPGRRGGGIRPRRGTSPGSSRTRCRAAGRRPGDRRGIAGVHRRPGADLLAGAAVRGPGNRRRRHPPAARGGGRRPVLADRPPVRATGS